MATQLTANERFADWLVKINALITEFNSFYSSSVVPGSFGFNDPASTGLTAVITGGKIRDGSEIETVSGVSLTLPAASSTIVAINKRSGIPAQILMYDVSEVPEQYVIPIGLFVTDTNSITSYSDYRTEFNTASGSSSSASGVLLFNKIIDMDVTVGPDQNAISVDPTVNPGVTVTVDPDSVWVIL